MTPGAVSGHPLVPKARRSEHGLRPHRISDLGLRISPAAPAPVSDVFEPSRSSGDNPPHPLLRRGWVAQHSGQLALGRQSRLDECPGAFGQGRAGDETIKVMRGDAVAKGVVEAQPFDEGQSAPITSA